MTIRWYLIVVSIVLIALVAVPLFQLAYFDGLVFYSNALDELAYLQFEHASMFFEHYNRLTQLAVI
ncbi:MAG: hypothetical protein KDD62_09430 [Bdellovibrionales bacterium]|nr:hypothetical protein [Bdellovibrionales bacterium]